MKERHFLKAVQDLTELLKEVRTRKVDFGEILIHCLSQFPFYLSNNDGSFPCTNKAALFHYLPDMKINIIIIMSFTALILDGMAIIQ